jgi:hypothetical protein
MSAVLLKAMSGHCSLLAAGAIVAAGGGTAENSLAPTEATVQTARLTTATSLPTFATNFASETTFSASM